MRPRILHELWRSVELRKAAVNSGWILAGTVISRLGKLAAVVVLARMLGPADFGLLGMAEAIIILMGGLAGGGLQKVVVKHLVRSPQDEARILGTAFVLRLGLSAASVLIALSAPYVLGLNQPELPWLMFLLSLCWLPGSLANTTGAYFQSRLQDRRNVQSRDLTGLGASAAKCLAALRAAPLWVYGGLNLLGHTAWALVSLRLMPKGWKVILGWRVDMGIARRLWPNAGPHNMVQHVIHIRQRGQGDAGGDAESGLGR